MSTASLRSSPAHTTPRLVTWLVAALVGLAALVTSIHARADVQRVGTPIRRPTRTPGPLERGPAVELSYRPAAVIFGDGVVPMLRLVVGIGGNVTSRLRLMMVPNLSIYLNRARAPGAGGDVMASLDVWRMLSLRLAAGAISALPETRTGREVRSGYGGFAGLAYEWTLKKRTHLGAGVDYDVRMLADGSLRHTVLAGVHFSIF